MRHSKNSHRLARNVRFITFVVVAALILLNNPQFIAAQPNAVTYGNPLAYVGADGNYYVTSLDDLTATAVTSDMVVTRYGYGVSHYGSRPHWSPQGTKFAFMDGRPLYVVESGKASQQIVHDIAISNDEFDAPDNSAIAWAPDGQEIAYGSGFNLNIFQTNGTLIRKLALSTGGQTGGLGFGAGPGPERAFIALGDERDDDFLYHGNVPLSWTRLGFLFSYGQPFRSTFLDSDTGTVIWTSGFLDNMILSPDSTRVLGNAADPDGLLAPYPSVIQPETLDLATGKNLPVTLSAGDEPLAWTPEGKSIIFARTKLYKHVEPITGSTNQGDDQEHFDYLLTLWRQALDGKQPRKLFETYAYGFGWVTVSPDNKTVVFSLIINSYFDKTNPERQILAVPIDGGQAQWIAIGSKPAFGNGPFTAIPASPPGVLQPVTCPKSLVSRLKIGQRARVMPGEPNSLRSQPAGGTGLRTLQAGSVFLVLDGPSCGSDGLAWWKVNYQGIVGWTAESDSKSYWLEQ